MKGRLYMADDKERVRASELIRREAVHQYIEFRELAASGGKEVLDKFEHLVAEEDVHPAQALNLARKNSPSYQARVQASIEDSLKPIGVPVAEVEITPKP